MGKYHYVIADDHPLFRGALRLALEGMDDVVSICEAASFDEVIEAVKSADETDMVLLDLNMPGNQGFSGLVYLRSEFPQVPVVIVSATEDAATMRRSLDFGASGFIPKSVGVDQIRGAIKKILGGAVWAPPELELDQDDDSETTRVASRLATLTPQQLRVLMMLNRGLLNKQIAYKLDVSEATVKAHVSAILQKLGVESRTQAVIATNSIKPDRWQWPPEN